MDYNSGSTYGYDQVYANTQLDDYDAPYSVNNGDPPNRTMKSTVQWKSPVASYYDVERRPYHSPDSSLLDSQSSQQNQDSSSKTSQGCGCRSSGIDGPIGKLLDCGCGCRGGKKVSQLREVKDKLLSGDVDLNNVYMFFIFMLAIILIVNSMNMKHLKDQVKMLTKAVTRSAATGPGPPSSA